LLNRIAIIFSRRKINIESLNTSPSEVEGIHRFNIVITETEEVVQKLAKQIEKQVEVLKVYYNTNAEVVWQEMALYKVSTEVIAEKALVERLLRAHGARARKPTSSSRSSSPTASSSLCARRVLPSSRLATVSTASYRSLSAASLVRTWPRMSF
jgi:acetolactate synthase regulatory subunit